MRDSVYQCDVCNRHLAAARITLFHIEWGPVEGPGSRRHDGIGHHVGLKCITPELTSGVRKLCDDCRRIAAEITNVLSTGRRDGEEAGEAEQWPGDDLGAAGQQGRGEAEPGQ